MATASSSRNRLQKYAVTALGLLTLTVAMPALASTDPMLEGAKQCTRNLPRQERNYGIPQHLLSAIATTESGRWHDGLRMALPWPWTINAEGKGYYFNSKQEAIQAARDLKAQGIKSMDVGCMQVNLYHHPKAFANLDQAFDPATNVEYAARFLRGNYEEARSWQKAAANYHSRTPDLGQKYVGRVFGAWRTILGKLDAARYAGGATTGNYVRSVADITPPNAVPEGGKRVALADKMASRALPAHKTPHMKIIKVENRESNPDATREKGVMVIRVKSPEPVKAVAETEVATAEAIPTPSPQEVLDPQGAASMDRMQQNGVTVLRSTGSAAAAAVSKRTGPNFIFN